MEKCLVVKWPRKEFHGKTSEAQFSVVCGGVCPVSHPSPLPQSALLPDGSEDLKSYWMGQSGGLEVNTCGLWSCKTSRQRVPCLHKDGSNNFYLEEFTVYRRSKIETELCLGLCTVESNYLVNIEKKTGRVNEVYDLWVTCWRLRREGEEGPSWQRNRKGAWQGEACSWNGGWLVWLDQRLCGVGRLTGSKARMIGWGRWWSEELGH